MSLSTNPDPEFVTEYDPSELPALKDCRTRSGNNEKQIEVELNGEEHVLRPGDVVETETSIGQRSLYFIIGRKGFIMCQELTEDLYYHFASSRFSQMANGRSPTLHRDPWRLSTDYDEAI